MELTIRQLDSFVIQFIVVDCSNNITYFSFRRPAVVYIGSIGKYHFEVCLDEVFSSHVTRLLSKKQFCHRSTSRESGTESLSA